MRQRKLATIRANGHYLLSGVLLLAIFPALKAVHLPAAVDWERLIPLYWVGFALRSIFAAVVLGVIGLPASVTVAPVWAHFARQKARLLIFIPFVFWAFWQVPCKKTVSTSAITGSLKPWIAWKSASDMFQG